MIQKSISRDRFVAVLVMMAAVAAVGCDRAQSSGGTPLAQATQQQQKVTTAGDNKTDTETKVTEASKGDTQAEKTDGGKSQGSDSEGSDSEGSDSEAGNS